MTLRRIAQLGEPVLRKAARPLAVDELGTREMQRLVSDMIDTMRDADGAGLAAPQIYESVQIAVIELRENPRYPDVPSIPLRVLINPKVT
ncbi:MAG TPA: peptide deformylase, partial [Polyangiaceae bacterium]